MESPTEVILQAMLRSLKEPEASENFDNGFKDHLETLLSNESMVRLDLHQEDGNESEMILKVIKQIVGGIRIGYFNHSSTACTIDLTLSSVFNELNLLPVFPTATSFIISFDRKIYQFFTSSLKAAKGESMGRIVLLSGQFCVVDVIPVSRMESMIGDGVLGVAVLSSSSIVSVALVEREVEIPRQVEYVGEVDFDLIKNSEQILSAKEKIQFPKMPPTPPHLLLRPQSIIKESSQILSYFVKKSFSFIDFPPPLLSPILSAEPPSPLSMTRQSKNLIRIRVDSKMENRTISFFFLPPNFFLADEAVLIFKLNGRVMEESCFTCERKAFGLLVEMELGESVGKEDQKDVIEFSC